MYVSLSLSLSIHTHTHTHNTIYIGTHQRQRRPDEQMKILGPDPLHVRLPLGVACCLRCLGLRQRMRGIVPDKYAAPPLALPATWFGFRVLRVLRGLMGLTIGRILRLRGPVSS